MILSVLLPVYNAEKYVFDAIESVLNQTYKDFEFIIINDGSTDRSLEIIKSFDDSRILLIDQKNAGLAKTLNRGLHLARGKYIARMDADDICMRSRFEEQINYLTVHPEIGLLGTAVELINEKGEHLYYDSPLITHKILTNVMINQGNPIKHPTVMFKKDIAVSCGGYNEAIGKYFEDYMLWHLMSMRCKVDNLPKILLKYRLTSTSIISTMKSKELDDFVLYVIRKGGFDLQDKKQWDEILNSSTGEKRILEDRNAQTPGRRLYCKFTDLLYKYIGDSSIKLMSSVKRVKYWKAK